MDVAAAETQELPITDLAATESSRAGHLVPIGLATLVFGLLSVLAAVTSDGFLEADACTHYLYARFAIAEPHYLVNVWGRPLCTGIYAIPAALGERLGVRLASLGLAIVCGVAAWRIARLQDYRWPALALIFTLAQPLVFLHSFSELTELPFATLIILAFWAYRVRHFWLMALLVGVSPLGRPEGFGFIGLAGLALVLHRRWYWLPLLVIPLILWNHAGWVIFGRSGPWWQWLPDNWPYAAESLYGTKNLLHFVALLPVVVSPLIFPAMVLGVWRSLGCGGEARRHEGTEARSASSAAPSSLRASVPLCLRAFLADHHTRIQMLIAIIPLLILVGHSLLTWLGKMASNGEVRYMLVVAPFWGLLSAKGWEWVFTRFGWRWPHLIAGAAALVPITANFAYQVVPLTFERDWQRAEQIAAWYEQWPGREQYPRLAASHPGIFYFLDTSPTSREHVREWTEDVLLATPPPPGTLLIWDSIYGVYNSDAARSITEAEIEAAGWEELRTFEASGEVRWRVFVSP